MNKAIVSYVGWLLLLTALGFYGYAITEAIRLSWPQSPGTATIEYHAVLSTTIGTIQALLLANLGALLGISVADPGSNVARALKLNRTQAGVNPSPLPPMELKDTIQLYAVLIYVISLIACFLTWIVNKFSSDPKDVVSVISESGKMFIGVFLAYITAILRK